MFVGDVSHSHDKPEGSESKIHAILELQKMPTFLKILPLGHKNLSAP